MVRLHAAARTSARSSDKEMSLIDLPEKQITSNAGKSGMSTVLPTA